MIYLVREVRSELMTTIQPFYLPGKETWIFSISEVLNWYCTKYTTKLEKSHSVQVFDDITSTKSLASRLWNVALRSLSYRECGALEAADTLLGTLLFSTDSNTTIRWVDVNMVRSRKLKDREAIEALDGESCDIFYPSWVDSYYPNRPDELKHMYPYNFLAWHDWEQKEPSKSFKYYPFMGGFLRRDHDLICSTTTSSVSVKSLRSITIL